MAEPVNLARSTVVDILDHGTQVELVEQARAVYAASPPAPMLAKGGLPMRVKVTCAGKLGWQAFGGGYQYIEHDHRGRPWPEIPAAWIEIANRVAGKQPWDCAILNWYDAEASLGWHRDETESDRTRPIVTISLGDQCSWAVRETRDSKVHRCLLMTGDVTLLAGESRSWWHTVERIIPCPLLSPLKLSGRVSITMRVAGKPVR